MVNGNTVKESSNELKAIINKYSTTINELNTSWKGNSYNNASSKAQEFEMDTENISEEIVAFSNACDLYEQYITGKRNAENATNYYNAAVSNNDINTANTYATQINQLNQELSKLQSQIQSYLSSASSYKMDASKISSSNLCENSFSNEIGELDMSNYPTGSSLEDGIARAVLVAKYLMKNGGFSAEQAAAMAGVYVDENNCDPGEVMEAEKAGLGVSGTGGNGYGAGIASWTFEDYKEQCLADAGFPPNTPIESLTMQQQCDMIIAMSQKTDKQYYDALKRCDTLEDASATAVVITGGVGFSNNWDTHPTPADAKRLSDIYGQSNDANFGASSYHWNLDQRRLEYAQKIYAQL